MKKNVLLMVPSRRSNIDWEDADRIILKIRRDGSVHKLMNKIFRTPLNPVVELDEIGSLVWKNCDGAKNLHEISEIMKSSFGDRIEPVYDRLLQYVGILKRNNFIKLE